MMNTPSVLIAVIIASMMMKDIHDLPGGVTDYRTDSPRLANIALRRSVRAPVALERSDPRTDTAKINQYMTYNAATKTVGITLVAAATSAQGGFNFNGGSSGDQTITVPAGWTVNVDFRNHDAIPHSAIVIKNQPRLPAIPQDPALARAYTSHLTDGLAAQTGHDTMQFTASPAGDYLMACGVPGHAASGMYIRFVVSATAAAPSNTGTIGPPQKRGPTARAGDRGGQL